MANTHESLTSLFNDTADAIREKSNSTEAIVADNFPTAIRNITTDFGAGIGDVFASDTITEMNSDWIKADGTVDVVKYRHPTLFEQLGLNEYRFSRYTRHTISGYEYPINGGGIYADGKIVFVGTAQTSTYGHAELVVTYNVNTEMLYAARYTYSNAACDGYSDVVYKDGYFFMSGLREQTNTTTDYGCGIHVFTISDTGVLTHVAWLTASNRSMHGIAATENGYVCTAGVKVDGTLTFIINNVANTLTSNSGYSIYNVTSVNTLATTEQVFITAHNNQFVVATKSGRYVYTFTPNASAVPTLSRSTSFTSRFTTIEGVKSVNGYVIVYGVYNGNAKIAYATSPTGTWTYSEIGEFTPVDVGYTNGMYYILGYSGTTKYLSCAAALKSLTGNELEIADVTTTPMNDDIPVAIATDGDGKLYMGSNSSSNVWQFSKLSPVVKQPTVTVSGKSNVFVRRTVGGVG